MTVLAKIKAFLQGPKAKAKVEKQEPATKAAETKAAETPGKKAGESGPQSTGTA
ncbi:MAG: hypothetical protein V1771_05465 [Chloroflexota bacterium]